MEKTNINKIQYSDKCLLCHLVIKGNSEQQIKYNMKVHVMQKHGVELSEVKRK